ncbi:MAG: ethylbenzene dehydrogenase-related protein [Pseudomonadales bacterium]|jgi:DMSO reductase family type II enzyme heme b subunit|nr:ethylbenzene dehydrogenase-related protein [Pseudomonadales bacterium]MDP7596967.1 ethylbenzene dehydrogenase-related protein [Pseudomonadales bacterium]HJN50853.1 ethylbenzene dehydrogenase-related protein [Pseudomonadales bacterium]|tara:strand:- start:2073 stop:2735 length:663 start_codon:yes stop_codon:yes gene_type:complete
MTDGSVTHILDAINQPVSFEELLSPVAAAWDATREVVISLTPTPLERQPSAYVQTVWRERPRGEVSEVKVRALCNDSSVVLRLDWAAGEPRRSINDVNVYADGCAVLFPANGEAAELDTMGSPEKPVAAWHWRAGDEQPFSVTATGIGSVKRIVEHPIKVGARWGEGRWRVALGSPLPTDTVGLARGGAVPVAFAVWCGAADDRGGLKSYSQQFHQLRLQ